MDTSESKYYGQRNDTEIELIRRTRDCLRGAIG